MARCILLYVAALLIFGHQQVTSVDYHLEDAIDDISFFIPGSKGILTTAVKLWSVYGELQELIEPNSTQIQKSLEQIDQKLGTIINQLNDISDNIDELSDDVTDLKNLVNEKILNELPKEFSLDSKMVAIYNRIDKVNSLFQKFLRYNDPTVKHANDTLLNFANSVVDHGLTELPSVLDQIHRTLVETYSGVNILDILANKRQSTTMMCKRQQSSQHFINNLYNNIMITELKGLLMTQFAYSIKEKFQDNAVSYETELGEAKRDSYERIYNTVLDIKKSMFLSSRETWTCDPPEHQEGVTYAKLSPIFQTYVMNEEDAEISKYLEKYTNKCDDTCAARKISRDMCRSSYCKKHEQKCEGLVRDCKSSDTKLKVCLADKNSGRRFEYIEMVDKGKLLGHTENCHGNTHLTIKDWIHYFAKCEYCFCTCESLENNLDRYFSLKNVTSDVHDNKVVTGVKLAKKNNMFHIQLQQGQLLKNGNINVSSIEWKPVDNFTRFDKFVRHGRDYVNITYDERSVLLNNLDSPLNNVLTGLRFQSEDEFLTLEVQVTPFNFGTGELKAYESRWISNSDAQRTELKLDDLDLPTSTFTNLLDSNDNQYIKFTTSSLKQDVGQTVVPFIDLQEITSSPPVPMSGAGLIHKGGSDSAGFLSLKLFTYNYAPYIQN